MDIIGRHSITQVDSTARHYGWAFAFRRGTMKGKRIEKVQDFIELAENRIADNLNARKISFEGMAALSTELDTFSSDENTR